MSYTTGPKVKRRMIIVQRTKRVATSEMKETLANLAIPSCKDSGRLKQMVESAIINSRLVHGLLSGRFA